MFQCSVLVVCNRSDCQSELLCGSTPGTLLSLLGGLGAAVKDNPTCRGTELQDIVPENGVSSSF